MKTGNYKEYNFEEALKIFKEDGPKILKLDNGLLISDYSIEQSKLQGREVNVVKGRINVGNILKMSNDKNVRAANIESTAGQRIKETLLVCPEYMPFRNRGITCYKKDDMIYIIDGGTTSSICQNLYNRGSISSDCELNIEMFMAENLSQEEIIEISAARNINTPPAEYTFANAVGVLEVIKNSIDKSYIEKIEFRQNTLKDKKKKRNKGYIDAAFLLRIFDMLDVYTYQSLENDKKKFPNHKSSYSLKPLIEGRLTYDYMTDIVNDILRIFDKLSLSLTDMAELYYSKDKEFKRLERYMWGDAKRAKSYETGVELEPPSKKTTIFSEQEYTFEVNKQIFYVFFSGLRANIKINPETKKAYWVIDVDEVFDSVIKGFWKNLCIVANERPGAGMDRICTPAVAKDLYLDILQKSINNKGV